MKEIEEHFLKFGIKLTENFNLEKLHWELDEFIENLPLLLCNLKDVKLMEEISSGNYTNFNMFDEKVYNNKFNNIMIKLGYLK